MGDVQIDAARSRQPLPCALARLADVSRHGTLNVFLVNASGRQRLGLRFQFDQELSRMLAVADQGRASGATAPKVV